MKPQGFDDILDQCLSMLQGGASIDDCVARYPGHADELRAQLRVAQTLRDTRPQVRPELATQARGRARLLTAVAERRETASATPMLGLLAPLPALFRLRWGRPALLAQALPAALALLLVSGVTLGALAATDAGGFRSAVSDAILRTHSDEDDDGADELDPRPGGTGGGDDNGLNPLSDALNPSDGLDAADNSPVAGDDSPDVDNGPDDDGDSPDVDNGPDDGDSPDVDNGPDDAGDSPDVDNGPDDAGDSPDVDNSPDDASDSPDVDNSPDDADDSPDAADDSPDALDSAEPLG